MLYYLFRFLEQYGISGSRIWGYISFRALLALILSLVISAWAGEKFIKFLKRKQITETQRDASIDPFGVKKIGVPSMGGVIIILSILVPVLLLGRLRNVYLILMIITTVWLGFLGGMDDYIKIFRRDKEGLKGKYKIVGQIGIGLIVGLVLWMSPDVKMNENIAIDKEGRDILIGFNPKFFIDALRNIDDEEITIYMVNPKAPCFIKDDDNKFLYLILPVNFNAA